RAFAPGSLAGAGLDDRQTEIARALANMRSRGPRQQDGIQSRALKKLPQLAGGEAVVDRHHRRVARDRHDDEHRLGPVQKRDADPRVACKAAAAQLPADLFDLLLQPRVGERLPVDRDDRRRVRAHRRMASNRCTDRLHWLASRLERDDFSSNRHPAPAFWWSMIFSENRYPLFGIML